MPQAAGVLGLIGTGISAVSSYQQGQDAKAISRNNAILAEDQAQETLRQGVVAQNQYRRQVTQLIGRQRAIIAANGVQDLGSPLALQEDAAAIGEADIANIRNQAALDAWGLRAGAANSIAKGNAYASSANAGAYGDLLTAGGQAYGLYKGRPKKPPAILGGYSQADGQWIG